MERNEDIYFQLRDEYVWELDTSARIGMDSVSERRASAVIGPCVVSVWQSNKYCQYAKIKYMRVVPTKHLSSYFYKKAEWEIFRATI